MIDNYFHSMIKEDSSNDAIAKSINFKLFYIFYISEQTKFLGGDVEHTHLVKGLDYALLRKIREKERAEADIDIEEEVVTSNSVVNVFDSKSQHPTGKIPLAKVKESFKECRTTTSMGENLKKYFLNPTEAKIDVVSITAMFQTIYLKLCKIFL